jgi:nucleoside 2-deoxyribosyltransferase
MQIYLAGPEVFLPIDVARRVGAEKKEICARHGHEGVYPFDEPVPDDGDIGHLIFDACVRMMDACDVVVANMTPWRGVSMDVGTAVEIGYMHGKGKPVFGYTNDARSYADRCPPDGFVIEPFGFHDNLMCDGPVWRSGGVVVRRTVAPDALYTALDAFEECVRQVRPRVDA